MDTSFNDQELSDIMKEIESLEENMEMSHETQSPVIEELAQMEEEKAIPFRSVAIDQTHEPKRVATTGMSFKVSGDLNIELQFDVGGKVICLEVSEAGLNIQIEGGMTFTVPLDQKSFKKSA